MGASNRKKNSRNVSLADIFFGALKFIIGAIIVVAIIVFNIINIASGHSALSCFSPNSPLSAEERQELCHGR